MAAFVFKCPITQLNIQHRLDDGEDVPENEYEVVKCVACTRLHFINRKTGDLLGTEKKNR